MRIGFCTGFDESAIKFAGENGFEVVEVFVSEKMCPNMKEDDIKRAKDILAKYNVQIMSIFHCEDYGHPDKEIAKRACDNLIGVMNTAKEMGVEIVTLNAFAGHGTLEEKFKNFKKIFTEFCKIAEDKGLKLAFENCPHGLHNLGYSPTNWERMFNEVPSMVLGIEYDPSHLVWQGIDYIRAIREFGDRIYAVHAKDTEILYHVLSRSGNLETNWWRYRIPGLGDINWKAVFNALWDIGYKGDITIEHEDPVFHGERYYEGLIKGLRYLNQYAK